jgi:hypothetical protein
MNDKKKVDSAFGFPSNLLLNNFMIQENLISKKNTLSIIQVKKVSINKYRLTKKKKKNK